LAKVPRFGYLVSRCIDEIYNTVIADIGLVLHTSSVCFLDLVAI